MANFTPVTSMQRNTLPDAIGVDQLRRKNALADRGMAVDEANAASYRNQLGMTQQNMQRNWLAQDQQAEAQQRAAVDEETYGLALNAKSNPALLPSVVGKIAQHPEIAAMLQKLGKRPEDIGPDEIDDVLAYTGSRLGKPPIQAPVQFEQLQGPRGAVLQRDPRTGELKQVVAPDNSPPPPPRGPNWTKIEQPLPDGRVQVGFVDTNSANPEQTFRPVGAPTSGGGAKPPTETDKKVSVLFNSLTGAEKDIQKLKKENPKGANTSSIYNTVVGSNPISRPLQTNDYRKYESAGLRWAANLLYIKSGATATPDEIRSTWKQFFPQPGDGTEVAAQKEAARKDEMAGIAKTYSFENPFPALNKGVITRGSWKVTEVK